MPQSASELGHGSFLDFLGVFGVLPLLRTEGVPGLEMLARYGDDLLSALASLERHGVVHRDIKPDNIGIRSLTKQRNQLILFDFSLARASLENIHVGTEGYRDPFLKNRKPVRPPFNWKS